VAASMITIFPPSLSDFIYPDEGFFIHIPCKAFLEMYSSGEHIITIYAMRICICSSMTFYEEFSLIAAELEVLGHTVSMPEPETERPTVSVGEKIRSEHMTPEERQIQIERKGVLIANHFRKIDASDAILVTNYAKHGINSYIGGNSFLEMGYAYGTGKKLFVLFDLPQEVSYKDELAGMQPICLHGDIAHYAF
jgi:hypothetical protein